MTVPKLPTPAQERRVKWITIPGEYLLCIANLALRRPDADCIAIPHPGADLPDDAELVDCRYLMETAAHALLVASKHFDRVPPGHRVPIQPVELMEMRAVRLRIYPDTSIKATT